MWGTEQGREDQWMGLAGEEEVEINRHITPWPDKLGNISSGQVQLQG